MYYLNSLLHSGRLNPEFRGIYWYSPESTGIPVVLLAVALAIQIPVPEANSGQYEDLAEFHSSCRYSGWNGLPS